MLLFYSRAVIMKYFDWMCLKLSTWNIYLIITYELISVIWYYRPEDEYNSGKTTWENEKEGKAWN